MRESPAKPSSSLTWQRSLCETKLNYLVRLWPGWLARHASRLTTIVRMTFWNLSCPIGYQKGSRIAPLIQDRGSPASSATFLHFPRNRQTMSFDEDVRFREIESAAKHSVFNRRQ